MTQRLYAGLVAVAAPGIGQPSWAWEHTGPEWISGIAIEKLPESVPAFVRTAAVDDRCHFPADACQPLHVSVHFDGWGNDPNPIYALQKEGGFVHGDRRGIAFATDRLAAGAIATRNMIVDAWLDSANGTVGFAGVKVSDIESGKVKPTREMFGSD